MPRSLTMPGLRLAALSAGLTVLAAAAQAAPPTGAKLAAWQSLIRHMAVSGPGCFTAAYPSTSWTAAPCKVAPARPYLPRTLGGIRGNTAGDGNDYAAKTKGLTGAATGSFPTVTGLTSETGYGGAKNVYSLQLNSGFMSSAACAGSTTGSCLGWQQFLYSSSEKAVFMQYWLIDYGRTCPSSAWTPYQGSCYRNSQAVSAPQIAATKLGSLALAGSAAAGGMDVVTLTAATTAYATSGNDSVVDLAATWSETEFNVVGDGGGSQAKFNKGTSLGVSVQVTQSGTAAPSCAANAGTTGETSNLTLGTCGVSAGGIAFKETH